MTSIRPLADKLEGKLKCKAMPALIETGPRKFDLSINLQMKNEEDARGRDLAPLIGNIDIVAAVVKHTLRDDSVKFKSLELIYVPLMLLPGAAGTPFKHATDKNAPGDPRWQVRLESEAWNMDSVEKDESIITSDILTRLEAEEELRYVQTPAVQLPAAPTQAEEEPLTPCKP